MVEWRDRGRRWAMSMLLAVGCTAATRPPAAPNAAPTEDPTSPSSSSTAPARNAAPPTSPPSAGAEDGGAWHVVATGEMPLFLHALDGAVFVSSGPWLARIATDGRLDQDVGLRRNIATFRGPDPDAMNLTTRWEVLTLDGRWPDETFLVTEAASGAASESFEPWVHRWATDRWLPRDRRIGRRPWYPERVRPWQDGNLLALRRFRSGGVDERPARRKELIVIRGAAASPSFGERRVVAFDSLTTGHIFAVTGSPAAPRITRWSPDGTITDEPLPNAATRGPTIALDVRARDPHDVVVFGGIRDASGDTKPYVAQRQGASWTSEAPPPCAGRIVSWLEREATAWAVCGQIDALRDTMRDNQLFVREAAGGWTPQPLPRAVAPVHVAAVGKTLWLTALTSDPTPAGVLMSKTASPPQTVVGFPTLEAVHHQLLEWSDRPPKASCSAVSLVLEAAVADAASIATTLDALVATLATTATRSISIALVRARYRGTERLLLTLRGEAPSRRVRTVRSKLTDLGLATAEPTCFAAALDAGFTIRAWPAG